MSGLKGFKNPKSFFDEGVQVKLLDHKDFLVSAGIRSKTISLEIEGEGGGAWSFSFDSEGHVAMVPQHLNLALGDCLIQMNEKTFAGILDGSVNVPMAFMFRKIKVKGDSGLAVKLGMALQKNFMS